MAIDKGKGKDMSTKEPTVVGTRSTSHGKVTYQQVVMHNISKEGSSAHANKTQPMKDG